MHILLGLLGFIVTILILLHRLSESGLDIGWLNPFAWQRRREWAKKYHANPVFSLTSPMEVTALLMVSIAKADGDMTAGQKQGILRLFRDVFNLDERQAAELLGSSVFLLRNEVNIAKQVDRIVTPCRERFSTEQMTSASELLGAVACLEGEPSDLQEQIVNAFRKVISTAGAEAKWA